MDIIFDKVFNFFGDLQKYDFNCQRIFLFGAILFLLSVVAVIISTSHAYEARLIKAIDMFNYYFIDNPQIDENNLLAFNEKMKSRKVPKQLRKHWQQFVLYREHNASYYMSFDNCVSNPIKNSTFKRDISTLNIVCYIICSISILLNLFCTMQKTTDDLFWHEILMGPILILVVNFIVTIFLQVRHNAIVSDLYQNYQYFEVNIDKATQTLPEYVDYELLFDKNEIKKGIPILYTYLQKRAEEEKRELERARLKNIEHEKYNFEDAGVDGSLVLERAMQEAENYIAERKKFNQDIEQINSDISQEDLNYREITKEYNRQMQVSKETFANFKSQMENVSSTIEANYLKKQQQQELDRQRNLERDFDTATEKHKKVIESFHQELESVDKFREQSRNTLEKAMMSEFETYSEKVFQKVKVMVEEKQKEKFDELKKEIQQLEEKIVGKNKELETIYGQNSELNEKLQSLQLNDSQDVNYNDFKEQVQNESVDIYQSPEFEASEGVEPAQTEQDYTQVQQPEEQAENSDSQNLAEQVASDAIQSNQEQVQPEYTFNYLDNQNEEPQEQNDDTQSEYEKYLESLTANPFNGESNDNQAVTLEGNQPVSGDESGYTFNYLDNEQTEPEAQQTESETSEKPEDVDSETSQEDSDVETHSIIDRILEKASTKQQDESESKVVETEKGTSEQVQQSAPIKKRAGRPRKIKTETINKEPKRRGRPRKQPVEVETVKIEKKRGRPRKVETNLQETKQEVNQVKQEKRRGRPRKVEQIVEATPKKHRGRPRKQVAEQVLTEKKKPGRPKKQEETVEKKAEKRRGRPRKIEQEPTPIKKRAGRPRKQQTEEKPEKRKVGRPKNPEGSKPRKSLQDLKAKRKPEDNVGTKPEDIDKYLKQIDAEIAKENKRLEKTKKLLEKKSKIKK